MRSLLTTAFLLLAIDSAHSVDPTNAFVCGQTSECVWIAGNIELNSPIIPVQQSYRFEALTDGTRWRARLIANSATNKGIAAFDRAWDGETLYEISLFDTNRVGPTLFAGKDGLIVTNRTGKRPANTAEATLTRSAVPMRGGGLFQFVWLANFSGCDLRAREAAEAFDLPPLYSPPFDYHDEYSAPANWKLSAKFPFCPEKLVFQGGDTFAFSAELGEQRIQQRPSFTNLIFFADSWTNVGAWTFPSRYTATGFRAPPSPEAPSSVGFIVKGMTTVVRRAAWTNDFAPPVPSVTAVFDFRLSHRSSTHYYVKRKWLSLDDVRNGRTEANAKD